MLEDVKSLAGRLAHLHIGNVDCLYSSEDILQKFRVFTLAADDEFDALRQGIDIIHVVFDKIRLDDPLIKVLIDLPLASINLDQLFHIFFLQLSVDHY